MKVVSDQSFVGVAVPINDSKIADAYWCTPAAIKSLMHMFNNMSVRKITKAAGKARLVGVVCRSCDKEIVANNRGHAINEIAVSKKTGGNRVQCAECFRTERARRTAEQVRRWKAEGHPPLNKPADPSKAAKPKKAKAAKAPTVATKDEFYKSWEWRTLRMEVLKEHGRACQCCGAEPGMKTASGDPVRICVDHIKPLSKFWHLRLERKNLQVLCDECNQGKGNWDQTDFRKPEAPDEWIIEDAGIDQAILHQLTDPTTGRLQ